MADYSKYFAPAKLWKKCKGAVTTAGEEVIEKALWLYFALERPETPAWAKATIYSAIGYFILPIDAVPDALPAVGYSDDLGVILGAVAAVAMHIDSTVKRKARTKMSDWGM